MGNTLDNGRKRKRDVEWLAELKPQKEVKQSNTSITTEMVTEQATNTPNWKCPDSDRIEIYLLVSTT